MTSDADAPAAARRLDLLTDLSGDLHTALADGERALSADGDLRASRPSFERAYQLAELAGDVPALAVAAIGLAGLWVSERRTMTGAVMLESRLQDVLGRLPASSPLALRIRARLAAEADYREGEHARVMQVLDEARAAADPVPLAEALSLAHHCLLGPGHIRQRRELATELIGVSFRTGQRSDRMMGLLWQTVDSYAEGDPHAGRLLGELRSLLSEHDHAAVSFVVSAIEVMLAIRAGRLEDAESLANVCATSGAAAGDIDSEWWPGAQLVTVRWYQGRLAELQPMLSERVNSPVLSAVDNSAVAALAVAAAQAGDRRTAASCLATLRGPDLGRLPQSSSWLVTMNGVAEAAYTLGDAETAALVYDVLAPFSQIPLVGGLGVTCFGSAHQALGIACLTARQPDRAVGHLRSAVQHNLALAHWPAVVSARQRLAEAYGLRSGPDDDSAAREELSAAAAEAAALGIPGPVQPSRAALSLTHPGRSPETRPRENPAGENPASENPASENPDEESSGRQGPAVPGPARPDSAGWAGGSAGCVRAGRKWRLMLADRSVLVEDSIGMLHLAVLIANPRQDIPAAELAAGLSVLGRIASDAGTGQAVLDSRAVSEYRIRLAQLDATITELESSGSPERAAPARGERDWITAQLASAAGLSGRSRAFPDDSERARVAVGKAIRRALARIADADPVIGEHLRQSVHTGTRCSYWPG